MKFKLFNSTQTFAFTILSILLSTTCFAYNIDDAVQEAIKTNPDVMGRRFARQSACHLVNRARSNYLPTARLFGDVGEERANNNGTRALLGGDSRFTRKEGTIEVSEVLFDGGFRKANLEQSMANHRSSKWQVLESREGIAFNAAEAYLDVLRSRRIVEIYTDDVRVHEEILGKVTKRVEGGVGKQSEISLAESRLSLSRSQLLLGEANLKDANSRFIEVIGYAPPEEMETPELPLDLPKNIDEAQCYAHYQNPLINDARARTASARSQVDIAYSSFFPVISLDATTFRGDQLNGVQGRNFFFNGVVTANWEFFSGGRDVAQVNADKAFFRQSLTELASIKRSVNDEINSSLNAYKIEFDRQEALQQHVKLSWEVYQNYGKEFEVGSRTFFDLLNSQVEFFRAQVTEATSFYNHRLLGYRVLAAMGKLSPYFNYIKCREKGCIDIEAMCGECNG